MGPLFMSTLPLGCSKRVILPTKADLAVLQGDQPGIGDGHAVRVVAQIPEQPLRVGKRPLGERHPVLTAEGRLTSKIWRLGRFRILPMSSATFQFPSAAW